MRRYSPKPCDKKNIPRIKMYEGNRGLSTTVNKACSEFSFNEVILEFGNDWILEYLVGGVHYFRWRNEPRLKWHGR